MDKKVLHNCSDMIEHDKNAQEPDIIDVAIPIYHDVVIKNTNITKYCDLEIEIQMDWNLEKLRTVLVVICTLETFTLGICCYLQSKFPTTF